MRLRQDLKRLGLARAEGHSDPEDHIGTICEIMSGFASGRLPSVGELSARFRQLDEDVAMPSAGSLVGFIYAREGVAGLRARWRSGAGELLPDSGLIVAWQTHLAGVQPETLDIARVMQEGC